MISRRPAVRTFFLSFSLSCVAALLSWTSAWSQCDGFGPMGPNSPSLGNVYWTFKDSVSACPPGDSVLAGRPARLRITVDYTDGFDCARIGVRPESIWVSIQPVAGSGNIKVNDQGAVTFADDSTDGAGRARITIPSFSGSGKVKLTVFVSGVNEGFKTATVRTADFDADGRVEALEDSLPNDLNYSDPQGIGSTDDLQLTIPHAHHWRRQALHGTLVRRTNLDEAHSGDPNTIGDGDLSWSPDGRRVVYTARDAGGYCRVKFVPSDPAWGNSVRNLTFDGAPGDSNDYDPSWSPLATMVVYHRRERVIYRKGVVGYSSDTSNVGIATFNEPVTMTALSPNGQTIAFIRFVAGQGRIFTLPVSGGSARTITSGTGFNDFYPKWSPDGQSLTFHRSVSGQPKQLYTVSLTDSTVGTPQLLYGPSGQYSQYPAYSADGQVVVAGVGTSVAPITQVVDASGEAVVTGVANYAAYTYGILSPRVSPDGTRLSLLAKTPWNPSAISPQVWAARRNMNTPPQFTMIGSHAVADSNQTVSDAPTAGNLFTFAVSASDAESDPLAYAAYFLRDGMTFDPATRTFAWTPPLGTECNVYYVKFSVRSPSGGTDAIIDKFTVQQCGPLRAGHPREETIPVHVASANPTSGAFAVVTEGTLGTTAKLSIFDVAGRRVTTLTGHAGQPLVWDGRNETGAMVPTGIYLYRLTIGGLLKSGRIAIVR